MTSSADDAPVHVGLPEPAPAKARARVAPLQPSWLVAVLIIDTLGNPAAGTPRLDSAALVLPGMVSG
jgi:hypothetical protein